MDHKTVLIFLCTTVLVNGQITIKTPMITNGTTNKCPNVTTQQNFDINKYTGIWYEIKKFNIIVEANSNCIWSNYTLLPNNSLLMNNTFVKDNKNQSMITLGREANATHDGILKVTVPSFGHTEGIMYILGTDYTDYSVLWACIERSNSTPMEFAWVLGRNITLSPAKQTIVNNILDQNLVNQKRFITTKHDPETCWKKDKSSATITNSSILLLTITVILKYFI